MSPLQSLFCPHCGGDLQIDTERNLMPMLSCPYCGQKSLLRQSGDQVTLRGIISNRGKEDSETSVKPVVPMPPETAVKPVVPLPSEASVQPVVPMPSEASVQPVVPLPSEASVQPVVPLPSEASVQPVVPLPSEASVKPAVPISEEKPAPIFEEKNDIAGSGKSHPSSDEIHPAPETTSGSFPDEKTTFTPADQTTKQPFPQLVQEPVQQMPALSDYLRQAGQAIAQKNWPRYNYLFKQIIQHYPDDPSAYAMKARLFERTGSFANQTWTVSDWIVWTGQQKDQQLRHHFYLFNAAIQLGDQASQLALIDEMAELLVQQTRLYFDGRAQDRLVSKYRKRKRQKAFNGRYKKRDIQVGIYFMQAVRRIDHTVCPQAGDILRNAILKKMQEHYPELYHRLFKWSKKLLSVR